MVQVEAYKGALLAELGVSKGDVVATISRNRPEWATAAYATYACGAAYVPMYENQQESLPHPPPNCVVVICWATWSRTCCHSHHHRHMHTAHPLALTQHHRDLHT